MLLSLSDFDTFKDLMLSYKQVSQESVRTRELCSQTLALLRFKGCVVVWLA
jgi:hypothetical protein